MWLLLHGESKRTYSTAVRSPHYIALVELEIRVEDTRVELYFPVELVADSLPVGRRLGHVQRRIVMGCASDVWRCRLELVGQG